MPAVLLDGKRLAETMQAETAAAVQELVRAHGVRPGLAAVLVGNDPASEIYVRNKRKKCEQVGIDSWLHELPATTTQEELLDLLERLNANPAVHGILVQLPLPRQIHADAIIRAVSPAKGPTW
jgi:methylenetetrahydrofolate dehydrogenase (NADP+)/methenyltetrahydrofolate cyclohydrolase